MLKNTFLHIPGIGAITEQRLWNSGITDWDTPFDNTLVPISSNRKITIIKGIEESIHHLDRDNSAFSLYFGINFEVFFNFAALSGFAIPLIATYRDFFPKTKECLR
jgi:hypothetical protein